MAISDALAPFWSAWGTIKDVEPGRVRLAGISEHIGVGYEIRVVKAGQTLLGEVVSVSKDEAVALLYSPGDALRIGDRAWVQPRPKIHPSDAWLGKIVSYRGDIAGGSTPTDHEAIGREIYASPPEARGRRTLGSRLRTGWMATDTILPICRGQRMGLFAGSGVGKSTFLSKLAAGVNADRIVIALIGERSREINEFVTEKLPAPTLSKSVIVAASASEPANAKKRAAYCAMATAEHFRDEGHHVLLLFDSITRFAEAHRETALAVGETPALHAFPPSTTRVVSELAERSGPGSIGAGDITAIFSVLVAGSNLEEPVADMIRGILDGHIVLSREIAERGRYPAIDALKSVSRSLPGAANEDENGLIGAIRSRLSLHQRVEPMLRAGLFEPGHDAQADLAIAQFPALDAFIGASNPEDIPTAFTALSEALDQPGDNTVS